MPSETTTRRRSLPLVKGGTTGLYDGDRLLFKTDTVVDLSGTQETVSEGHQVSLLGKTDADIGGDFETFKSEVAYLSHPYKDVRVPGGFSRRFTGSITPLYARPLRKDEMPLSSHQELVAKGATAVSRCSPVDRRAELLTSAAETLKEGLPSLLGSNLWKDRTRIAKGAGSEYLNAQFGWVPLYGDIVNSAISFRKSAEIIRQLKRDSGRVVRRTYSFPVERETQIIFDESSGDAGTRILGGNFTTDFWSGSLSGRHTHTREITRKTWFSGAFTYHVPIDDTQLGKVMSAYVMMDNLYGTAITPEVVWNLTPWSWATDWFANTGDVLANVSSSLVYGQVLKYGYLMEQTTVIDRFSCRSDTFRGGEGPYSAVVKSIHKRRIKANPFGFGVDFGELNAYQLSILAALGMSRR